MIASEIANGNFFTHPFPYFVSSKALTDDASSLLLNWFEGEAPWNLVEADFYEQYEFDLRHLELPEAIKPICDSQALSHVKKFVESKFEVELDVACALEIVLGSMPSITLTAVYGIIQGTSSTTGTSASGCMYVCTFVSTFVCTLVSTSVGEDNR